MIVELDKKKTTIIASSDTVGAFPVRQDITVLPPDDPSKLRLGWKVYEHLGVEIYPYDSTIQTADEIRKKLKVISTADGIHEGDEVFVGTLWGWAVGVIHKNEQGDFHAETEGNIFTLQFDGDDRHCWVSTCQISKSLVTKLEI